MFRKLFLDHPREVEEGYFEHLGVAVFALFVLRWREPNAPRPFKALGYPVEWREYPMPHSVCPEEIADIAAFLVRIL